MADSRLEAALADMLERTIQAVETGVAFATDQLPDVIQQLLAWHLLYNLVWSTLGFTVLAVGVTFLRRAYCAWRAKAEWAIGSHGSWTDALVGLTAFGTALSTIGLIMFLASLTWVKILVAPKVFLLEYAAGLV